MRVARHGKELLRWPPLQGREQIDVNVPLGLGHLAHDLVHEPEVVVDQVVHVGRHREV